MFIKVKTLIKRQRQPLFTTIIRIFPRLAMLDKSLHTGSHTIKVCVRVWQIFNRFSIKQSNLNLIVCREACLT